MPPVDGLADRLGVGEQIPDRGSQIETPAGGDPRVNALLFWGMYESAEIRFVQRHIGSDLDVVELGSGLAAFSVKLQKNWPGRENWCVSRLMNGYSRCCAEMFRATRLISQPILCRARLIIAAKNGSNFPSGTAI